MNMLNNTASKTILTSSEEHIKVISDDQEDYLDIQLLGLDSKPRVPAEKFIQDIFFNAYGARVQSFYPLLLTLTGGDKKFAAVAGARPASLENLFSEQYLENPIEHVIQTPRENIIEIGNLAPANAGQARWLITTLSAFMVAAGFTHVVFTAVPRLRNAFQRMGLPLTEISAVKPDQLTAQERYNWGNYYDTKPVLCSGELIIGAKPLAELAKRDAVLNDLCQRATEVGQNYKQYLKHNMLELALSE